MVPFALVKKLDILLTNLIFAFVRTFSRKIMQVLTVNYADRDAPTKFCQSLRETGFAVLSNHPIPIKLIEQVYSDWRSFFQSDEKVELSRIDLLPRMVIFHFELKLQKIIKFLTSKNFIIFILMAENLLS